MRRPTSSGENPARPRGLQGEVASVPYSFSRLRAVTAFEWSGANSIIVEQGGLKDAVLDLGIRPEPGQNRILLGRQGSELGHCLLDHKDPVTGSVVAEVCVREDVRRMGLGSILVYIGLREELKTYRKTSFMVRLSRPHETPEPAVGQFGFALARFARRLGFTPEYNLRTLFCQTEIESVKQLAGPKGTPPAYAVRLTTESRTLLVYLADEQTGQVLPPDHWLHDFPIVPATVEEFAEKQALIAGNLNYVLRSDGIPTFVNSIARDKYEAEDYFLRIIPYGTPTT